MHLESKLVTRNVTIAGKRTSLRLEVEGWDALDDVCHREGLTLHELCTIVDSHRRGSSRTSAVRAFIVLYFREALKGQDVIKSGRSRVVPSTLSAMGLRLA